MNELEEYRASRTFSRPERAKPEEVTRLSILANRTEKVGDQWIIGQLDAPTGAVRDELEKRRKHLKDRLEEATPDEIEHILACFFAGYPTLRYYDKDAAERMLDVYKAGLRGKPLWVIDDMLARLTHQGATPLHPPTHTEMARLADAILAPFAREREEIDRVLSAKVLRHEATQEERDRAADHWEQLKSTLSGRTPAEQEQERQRIEREKAAHVAVSKQLIAQAKTKAGITDDLPHSPELRRKLVAWGANFGGRTGVGDVLRDGDGPEGGGRRT